MATLTPEQDAAFNSELMSLQKFARAFARKICYADESYEDVVQQAFINAWRAKSSFVPGTNMKAWFFSIIRNYLFSQRRRTWRMIATDFSAGNYNAAEDFRHTTKSSQEWSVFAREVAEKIELLTPEQRNALMLVGYAGNSYEDAAKILNCAVGTVKSRVTRARDELQKITGFSVNRGYGQHVTKRVAKDAAKKAAE